MTFQHRVPLAWRNLTQDRRRLAVAVSGIGFAVVLMFMQTGFRNALFDSTLQILVDLNADIVLISKLRYMLPANQTFGMTRLRQAKACEGVKAVYPVYTERTRAVWKQPGGRAYPIRVLASDPADPALLIPEVSLYACELKQKGTALIDRKNKSIYGPPGSRAPWNQWRDMTLAGQAIRLVGTFQLATDFVNDGNLYMSSVNFARFFAGRTPGADPLDAVDLGVVQLEEGTDPQKAKQRIAARMPDDVNVYTKAEAIARERNFWSTATPVGYVFMLGTAIGFVVGTIICYQIIQSDIADHMPEFATLKAMGYRNSYFVGFVLLESVYLSLLGFIPGTLVAYSLYEVLARCTGLLMVMTVPRAASMFLMTLGMCIASGCLAMRKVIAADPASLF
jgi:putative ABC transport system permease protein